MFQKKIIIAVDGHSSCGKSTLAKDVAKKLNYIYIDSGAMYRAVTLFCMQNNLITPDKLVDVENLEKRLNEIDIYFKKESGAERADTYLNGQNIEKEIRTIEVSNLVSPVSTIKSVRQKLVDLQRKMSIDKGIIMDGRDIGTVVFPQAELKLFVTASIEVRSQRRYDELIAKGDKVTFDEVKENLSTRDFIDSTRDESPLRKADDAIMIDNSNLTRDQQVEVVLQIIREKLM